MKYETIGNADYGQEFYRYLLGILLQEKLSHADAQEQTQEIYLRALKYLHREGSWPDNPKAWLTVTLRRVHMDFRRKQNGRGKTKRPRVIPLSSFSKERDSGPNEILESKPFVRKANETARMTWLELLEIRGGVQVVDTVKLVEWGHTKKEIAKLLGVTVRTVEMRLRLARDIVSRALSA